MVRVILAALAGSVLLFLWGYVAWVGLHLYDFAFGSLPDERSVVSQLSAQIEEEGAFFIPGMPVHDLAMSDEEMAAAQDAWVGRHRAGPIALILFRPEGADPGSTPSMIRGFAIEFIAALLVCILLRMANFESSGRRLLFVVVAALFAMIATHALLWNFFHLPSDYTLALVIDGLVGWLIAGLAIASILKPTAVPPAAAA